MDLEDRRLLAAARLWAAHRYPYLAHALFACAIVPAEGIGGIKVDDRWRLYVDVAEVPNWRVEELGSWLIHHVGHLLRAHAERARALGIDPQLARRWNLAADIEINDDLERGGEDNDHDEHDLLSSNQVTPEDVGLASGRLTEEYFGDFLAEMEGGDCGSGAHGWPREYEESGGMSSDQTQLLRGWVASEIVEFQRGKEQGLVPAGWLRWAHDLLRPSVDWRKVLAAEVRRGVRTAVGLVDYSYTKPSRRQAAFRHVVLPSLRKPVPSVAIICDTSASMSESDLALALTEVEGLLQRVGLARDGVHVLSCDASAYKVQRVTSARQVHLYGGGGTNMDEGIKAALDIKPRPSVIVVLTDGYTPWSSAPPKGASVIAGLLGPNPPPAPRWARAVRIEPPSV